MINDRLARLLQDLGIIREKLGITSSDIDLKLGLPDGYISMIEAGQVEPPLSVFLAICTELDIDVNNLTQNLSNVLGSEIVGRSIEAKSVDDGIVLAFQWGQHRSSYIIRDATLEEYYRLREVLRDGLLTSEKSHAVAEAFLLAVDMWPNANPSDLWYFIIPNLYYDPYNHKVDEIGKNLQQSWKRTSGWALERIVIHHYTGVLAKSGISLHSTENVMEKRRLLAPLNLGAQAIPEKADILLLYTNQNETRCFGVVHVKASFAERRTDDVPLSSALITKGYVSTLVTMDCKGTPNTTAWNPGELGNAWDGVGKDTRGQKRLDIEVDKKFDACFSFNLNTEPTPDKFHAQARIINCHFTQPDSEEPFIRWILQGWRRQFLGQDEGLE